MDDRWNRITDLYHSALTRDPGERAAYLREECPGDESLCSEVEKLLAYDAKAADFFDRRILLGSGSASSPGPEAIVPQERIGPYELESLLGGGGMAEVYLARDLRLGRRVALKLLRAEMAALGDARARFLREARSAAALNHPNIAAVFDTGEASGRFYLAMEYVDGRSLRNMLADGPLPESELLEYAMQLAAALDHAHSRGILHRDIKPENVIVEPGGAAKLVDFGIAKTLVAESEATEITAPGMFVGTLKYAPPEVLFGQPATRQSDLYSFGVMLFEMACGRIPFQEVSAMGVVGAILRGERASLRDVNAAVSKGLAEVVERCTARIPEDRFSTAAKLLAALDAVKNSGGAPVSSQTATDAIPSVVILEFANVSREPSMDWLGTGMMEAIEGEFRKRGNPQIVSRTRSQQVIRTLRLDVEDPVSRAALGRHVGARWVVTGSFQRAANRIRVTPAVLNVASGEIIPIEIVDGVWEDLFDVQDRVVAGLLRLLDTGSAGIVARPALSGRFAPSLDAYECYVSGRQALNQMGRESLAHAKAQFERAVALDPNYALAHSGLGSAYALTFIQTSNPQDLQRAQPHLERATELDPEIGEPYPWLCYLYFRLGDVKKSLASGELAVKRQPDYSLAHYFFAGAILHAVETGFGSYQRSVDGSIRALELEPRMAAPRMTLGWAALETANYAVAEHVLAVAWQMERTPEAPFRFVGARTMLGLVETRKCAWESARTCHLESIESLRHVQHVYQGFFTTLSACELGEIELRAGNPAEGLTHFRHAWRLVQEDARMLGNIRLRIRTLAGMAGAYALTGNQARAEQLVAEAASQVSSLDITSAAFGLLLPHVHYSIAVARQYLGSTADALTSLSSAVDTGWADPHWLQTDPVWTVLRNREEFCRLVERLHLIPPVTFDLSRLTLPGVLASEQGARRASGV